MNTNITRIIATALTLLFIAPGVTRASAESQPSDLPADRAAVECTPRGGWPHFFQKTKTGNAIRVAYLGGSITAQAGWRVKSLDYFKRTYPVCAFAETNAAIGGTGSDLGVLRIEHDVFAPAAPDLLFVEFAVNDASAQPVEIIRAMEGIVRKTWKAFPGCDIGFVYTFTDQQLDELKNGRLNRSAATMEAVADHYGIPTIHLGLEAVRLEKEGKLVMKAPETKVEKVSGDELDQTYRLPLGDDGKIHFSNDGVHPYLNTGHQLYVEAIIRSLPLIQQASKTSKPHEPGPPLDAGNYEHSKMLAPDQATFQGNWEKLPADDKVTKPFLMRAPSFWRADTNASLSLKFRGSAVGIYDLLGPDGSRLEISVDGKVSYVNRIDGYCTYWRLAVAKAANNLDPAKVHEVTIRVLPENLDKRAILFEKNQAFYDKNPGLYADNHWYVGAVFVVGELVK